MTDKKEMSPEEKKMKTNIGVALMIIVFGGMFLYTKYGDTPHNRAEKQKEEQLQKALSEPQNASSPNNNNSSNTESNYASEKACRKCGTKFKNGEGYCNVMGQIQQGKGDFYSYCSYSCAEDAKKDMEKKTGRKVDISHL